LALKTTNATQTFPLAQFEQLHLIKLKDILITNHIPSLFQLLVTSTAIYAPLLFLKIMPENDPSAISGVLAWIFTFNGLNIKFSSFYILDL